MKIMEERFSDDCLQTNKIAPAKSETSKKAIRSAPEHLQIKKEMETLKTQEINLTMQLKNIKSERIFSYASICKDRTYSRTATG